jgi:hypothetical protein
MVKEEIPSEPSLFEVENDSSNEKPTAPIIRRNPIHKLNSNTLSKARKAISLHIKRPPPTFPRFPEFPAEIRLQIWKEAIIPRVHELHPCAKLYNDRMTFRSNSARTPSIFHVNSEAREVALKHYQLMEYKPPPTGMTGKGILRFYFCPVQDTLLLNSLIGLFIMFMLLDDDIDLCVTVGVMAGWRRVAFDAERAQLITLLSGVAGHPPQPRFKEIFPDLEELVMAFDYTSKGKTRFRTSVWPGENGTSLRTIQPPDPVNDKSGLYEAMFGPMAAALKQSFGEGEEAETDNENEDRIENTNEKEAKKEEAKVPSLGLAKVERKVYIRGDVRYAFRRGCAVFGLRPRGIFRRL